MHIKTIIRVSPILFGANASLHKPYFSYTFHWPLPIENIWNVGRDDAVWRKLIDYQKLSRFFGVSIQNELRCQKIFWFFSRLVNFHLWLLGLIKHFRSEHCKFFMLFLCCFYGYFKLFNWLFSLLIQLIQINNKKSQRCQIIQMALCRLAHFVKPARRSSKFHYIMNVI